MVNLYWKQILKRTSRLRDINIKYQRKILKRADRKLGKSDLKVRGCYFSRTYKHLIICIIVYCRGVRRPAQNTFFDVRLTNVNAESQKHLVVETILKN